MKKVLLVFFILLNFIGCQNLNLYSAKKDYTQIEEKIKTGEIKIKENKIFYTNAFDMVMVSEKELELFKSYAEEHNLEYQ